MDENKIIRMANQIGEFFQSMPDHAEAVSGVVNHIRANWEPRLRSALKHHVETCGADDLLPIVKEALPKILAE